MVDQSEQYGIFLAAFRKYVEDIGSDRVMELDDLDKPYTVGELLVALETGDKFGSKVYEALRHLEYVIMCDEEVRSNVPIHTI